MGGSGSGRSGWREKVESGLRLDIDKLVRKGAIKSGAPVEGEIKFGLADDDLVIQFEARAGNLADSWIRLRYAITDHRTGEQHDIDDKIRLIASRPHFGGRRWWFVCPNTAQRVRKLYLPFGARRFRSRSAWQLAYESECEAAHDRARRRAAKLCRRLGGDPFDDHYPEKPRRMRWVTYNRLLDQINAANRVVDERFLLQASKLIDRCS